MEARIQTYTGKIVCPLDLDPELVDIRDIAHSLAIQRRFAGHTTVGYSIAQHSVHVAQLTGTLAGLLHDASEAYLGDVSSLLKRSPAFELYREAELAAMTSIADAFGVAAYEFDDPEIHAADRRMLRAEVNSFMDPESEVWDYLRPLGGERVPFAWPSHFAERMFLEVYRCLASCPSGSP